MNLDVERRTDWMESPGSLAVLTVGPFSFSVNTADGLSVGFAVRIWRWSLFWGTESAVVEA
jgi:hypothetical protein